LDAQGGKDERDDHPRRLSRLIPTPDDRIDPSARSVRVPSHGFESDGNHRAYSVTIGASAPTVTLYQQDGKVDDGSPAARVEAALHGIGAALEDIDRAIAIERPH